MTEFELGLELDSAEVRGILLYNNQEWGRYVQTILRDRREIQLIPLLQGYLRLFDLGLPRIFYAPL